MKSEKRIDRMCELLRQVWHLVPDWRLGQLIENLTKEKHTNLLDAFYIEDEDIEQVMRSWLKTNSSTERGKYNA